MFHYTVDTKKSVQDAVKDLTASLQNRRFGVLWQLDMPSKLQEKGVHFTQPYQILEVCNPAEAKHALSQNSLVGYFLPCKIVVYEVQGQTRIGLPKPTALMGMIDDKELRDLAERVENTLVEAINEAV